MSLNPLSNSWPWLARLGPIGSRLSAKAQARLSTQSEDRSESRSIDIAFSFLGAIVIGIGVSLEVGADVGFGPIDVLASAVAGLLDVSFAAGASIQALLAAVIATLLGRRVSLVSIATTATILVTIAFVSPNVPTPSSLAGGLAQFLVGVAIIGPGIGAVVAGDLGVGPYEQLTFALCDRTSIGSVALMRSLLELTLVVAGFLLGGAVGFGTVLTLVTIGTMVQVGARVMTSARDRVVSRQLG